MTRRPFRGTGLPPWELAFAALLFAFSAWIMFRTFSYDAEGSRILIGWMLWGDLGANLPLIRSFSLGQNWPPEYPIFPGPPIQYHYGFFLLVGWLERLGIRLDWALNVPSLLGFFAILLMIHLIAKRLFGDVRVAVLSVVFFLFNGSLAFLLFFEQHPLSWSTPHDVLRLMDYSAFGPWDGSRVLGVWHLNVFVNQRHFCLALGILLSFLYACDRIEGLGRRARLAWALLFGTLIGLFPLLHKAVLLVFAVAMSVYFVAFPRQRLFLFATGAVSLLVMGMLWLASLSVLGGSSGVAWHPGFMIHDSLSLPSALVFFGHQFGLHVVLIPVGFWLAPARARLFVLPAFLVFAIAFLFRFSVREVLVGHKFFNFFLIIGQMLTALAVVRAWDFLSQRLPHGRIAATAVTAPVVLLLTLSGVIDFFPILNMRMVDLADVDANPPAKWFVENTPPDAVVLSSRYQYTPASVAGRKIFLGWLYFTDSAGYASGERLEIATAIYDGEDPEGMCRLLRENDIRYVDVQPFGDEGMGPPVNVEYFRTHFAPDFVTRDGNYAVYSTAKLCP